MAGIEGKYVILGILVLAAIAAGIKATTSGLVDGSSAANASAANASAANTSAASVGAFTPAHTPLVGLVALVATLAVLVGCAVVLSRD